MLFAKNYKLIITLILQFCLLKKKMYIKYKCIIFKKLYLIIICIRKY